MEGEERKGIVDLVANTMQTLSSVQDVARRYAAYARLRSSLSDSETGDNIMKETTKAELSSGKRLAEVSSDKEHSDPLALKPIEAVHEDLFAPGTLFHVRGRRVASVNKKKTTDSRENCTLWKGYPKEHFSRIVLSSTMLSDHKCDSHYYALRDVLKGLPKSDDRRVF
eukprot:Gb_24175 [translate_table: standard]